MAERKIAPDPAGGMGSTSVAKLFGQHIGYEPLKSIYASPVQWSRMMDEIIPAKDLDDLKPELKRLLEQAQINAAIEQQRKAHQDRRRGGP